ncbi:MAG: hypothetical protein M1833_006998, partial [Piccolia ochrophora]
DSASKHSKNYKSKTSNNVKLVISQLAANSDRKRPRVARTRAKKNLSDKVRKKALALKLKQSNNEADSEASNIKKEDTKSEDNAAFVVVKKSTKKINLVKTELAEDKEGSIELVKTDKKKTSGARTKKAAKATKKLKLKLVKKESAGKDNKSKK